MNLDARLQRLERAVSDECRLFIASELLDDCGACVGLSVNDRVFNRQEQEPVTAIADRARACMLPKVGASLWIGP